MISEKHLLKEICEKLQLLTPNEDVTLTPLQNIILFKRSTPHGKEAELYPEGVGFILQGNKHYSVEGRTFVQSSRSYLTLLSPMPVKCELVQASAEKPLLGIALFIDRIKLADLYMRMEHAQASLPEIDGHPQSVITSAPMNRPILETLLRLVNALSNPLEMEILGETIEQELYFRLLNQSHENGLPSLLSSQGKVRQVAKAIEHINQHLDKPCSIEELSSLVNMSQSGFQKKFKEVMHISPLQYAKQVKLNRAKGFLSEGIPVSQTLLKVGYNNAGQFSREYKRHFGIAPSQDYQQVRETG